jgi:hypothetical protein
MDSARSSIFEQLQNPLLLLIQGKPAPSKRQITPRFTRLHQCKRAEALPSASFAILNSAI